MQNKYIDNSVCVPSYKQHLEDVEKLAEIVEGRTSEKLPIGCDLQIVLRAPHPCGFRTTTVTVPAAKINCSFTMEPLRLRDFILCSSMLIAILSKL